MSGSEGRFPKSLIKFQGRFATENECAEFLCERRWPEGLGCPGKPVHLEAAALGMASVALANATRETLRMADMFEILLREAFEVFPVG